MPTSDEKIAISGDAVIGSHASSTGGSGAVGVGGGAAETAIDTTLLRTMVLNMLSEIHVSFHAVV